MCVFNPSAKILPQGRSNRPVVTSCPSLHSPKNFALLCHCKDPLARFLTKPPFPERILPYRADFFLSYTNANKEKLKEKAFVHWLERLSKQDQLLYK